MRKTYRLDDETQMSSTLILTDAVDCDCTIKAPRDVTMFTSMVLCTVL